MKKLILLFIGALLPFFSFSEHIIGGDFIVQHVEGNTFQAILTLYRDCASGGAPFDPTVNVTVFEKQTDETLSDLNFSFISYELVESNESNSCIQNICLEIGKYETLIELPDNPNGYYFSKERCCRNSLSINLDAIDAGFVFTIDMPDPTIQNSSPQFSVKPDQYFFCVNNPSHLDFGCTDADGDSLVYSLTEPLKGASDFFSPNPFIATPKPYSTVPWAPGYSVVNQVGGNEIIEINPITGMITANTDQIGIFTLAVKVEEYRDGEKIGTIRREVQVSSSVCPENELVDFIEEPEGNSFDLLANQDFCLDFITDVSNHSRNLSLAADGIFFEQTDEYDVIFESEEGANMASAQFCWTPNEDNLSEDAYELLIKSYSVGCVGDTIVNQKIYFLEVTGVLNTEHKRSRESVLIYPNPNNGILKLKDLDKYEEDFVVHIYNSLGQLILIKNVENENSITLSSLSLGSYLVKLFTTKGALIQSELLFISNQ